MNSISKILIKLEKGISNNPSMEIRKKVEEVFNIDFSKLPSFKKKLSDKNRSEPFLPNQNFEKKKPRKVKTYDNFPIQSLEELEKGKKSKSDEEAKKSDEEQKEDDEDNSMRNQYSSSEMTSLLLSSQK